MTKPTPGERTTAEAERFIGSVEALGAPAPVPRRLHRPVRSLRPPHGVRPLAVGAFTATGEPFASDPACADAALVG